MSFSDLSESMHLELLNITGSRPITIPFRRTSRTPRQYAKSTRIGAEYVVSRSLHSLGVTVDVHLVRDMSGRSSSWRVGLPTYMFV